LSMLRDLVYRALRYFVFGTLRALFCRPIRYFVFGTFQGNISYINVIMKRKFKQWRSPTSTKWTITSHPKLNSLNTKKTTTYEVGNPGLGLRQAQKCGGAKPINGIPTLLSW